MYKLGEKLSFLIKFGYIIWLSTKSSLQQQIYSMYKWMVPFGVIVALVSGKHMWSGKFEQSHEGYLGIRWKGNGVYHSKGYKISKITEN